MINAVIVDDEKKSQKNLKSIIQTYCPEVEIRGIAGNIKDAIAKVEQLEPNLVFLDVQLGSATGFDFLRQLKEVNFAVIFTTAHSQFAIKAIKFSAVDYLLKPIDVEELQIAIQAVKQKLAHENENKRTIRNLLRNLTTSRKEDNKIALPTSNGLIFIKICDIVHCKGDNNYTYICVKSGEKYVVPKTLREYEELLADYDFFRIHKSSLINLNEIQEYIRGSGGYVVMSNGITLDVSKRRKPLFLQRIILQP